MTGSRALCFYIGEKMYAADITFIQKIVRGACVTPVLAAPDHVAGIIGVKAKVVTVLKIPNANAETGEYAVIFKPGENGDLFGILIDRPGELTEIDEMPGHCEIIDVKKITGGDLRDYKEEINA